MIYLSHDQAITYRISPAHSVISPSPGEISFDAVKQGTVVLAQ